MALIPERWRPVARIVGGRFLATAASPRFWRLRFGLATVVFGLVTVFLFANSGFLASADQESLTGFSRRLMAGLCAMAYLVAVILAPALILEALHEEKQSGLVDLLVTSPLSPAEIFVALLGSPFLACASAAVTGVAILALPIHLGGPWVLGMAVRAAVFIALGAALSGLYALRLATAGRSARGTWFDLFMFVVFTPFALLNAVLVIAFLILLTPFGGVPGAAWFLPAIFFLLFPFWGLFFQITGVTMGGSPSLLSCVSTIAGLLFLLRGSGAGFSAWLRRADEWKPRESRSYWRPGAWKDALQPWRRKAAPGSEAGPAAAGDGDTSWLNSLTRRRLAGAKGLAVEAYLLTRRNPFVAGALMAEGGARYAAGAFLAVIALFVLAHESADGGTSPAMVPTLAGLLLAAWITSAETARILPPRSATGEMEALLSAPLRGRDVVLGSAALIVLRLVPLLVAVAIINILPAFPFRLDASAARVLFFGAALLLAHGLSLWGSILFAGVSERVLAGFAAFAGLVGMTAFLWPRRAVVPHPLAILGRVSDEAVQLAAWAGVLAVAGLALTAGFALALRRMAAR